MATLLAKMLAVFIRGLTLRAQRHRELLQKLINLCAFLLRPNNPFKTIGHMLNKIKRETLLGDDAGIISSSRFTLPPTASPGSAASPRNPTNIPNPRERL